MRLRFLVLSAFLLWPGLHASEPPDLSLRLPSYTEVMAFAVGIGNRLMPGMGDALPKELAAFAGVKSAGDKPEAPAFAGARLDRPIFLNMAFLPQGNGVRPFGALFVPVEDFSRFMAGLDDGSRLRRDFVSEEMSGFAVIYSSGRGSREIFRDWSRLPDPCGAGKARLRARGPFIDSRLESFAHAPGTVPPSGRDSPLALAALALIRRIHGQAESVDLSLDESGEKREKLEVKAEITPAKTSAVDSWSRAFVRPASRLQGLYSGKSDLELLAYIPIDRDFILKRAQPFARAYAPLLGKGQAEAFAGGVARLAAAFSPAELYFSAKLGTPLSFSCAVYSKNLDEQALLSRLQAVARDLASRVPGEEPLYRRVECRMNVSSLAGAAVHEFVVEMNLAHPLLAMDAERLALKDRGLAVSTLRFVFSGGCYFSALNDDLGLARLIQWSRSGKPEPSAGQGKTPDFRLGAELSRTAANLLRSLPESSSQELRLLMGTLAASNARVEMEGSYGALSCSATVEKTALSRLMSAFISQNLNTAPGK